jgi:uncharacterized protein (DUF58 family)
MAMSPSKLSALFTYDFCPWANRWVYWMKRPAVSLGLSAVAALACAIFGKPAALVALGAIVVVGGLGYAWPTVSIRGLSASIRFRQRRVSEGEPARCLVQVVNRWPWPVWGISIETNFGNRESVALSRVGGWSSSEFEWELTPRCRGEFPGEAPQIATGFPFGLREARRPAKVLQSLIVWPQVIPLETLLDAAETRPSDEFFSEHRSGECGDMTGTRLFRPGDSLRRVHWAQTARTGRMIVCERQAPAISGVRVVFDSDSRMHRGSGRGSSLEWSIRIAASVCLAYQRENADVECCFAHSTIPVLRGESGRQKFLDALARWRPPENPAECEAAQAASCRRIHHHNCGVFQITITTDLGLAHRVEHRHVHGDQRVIVLQTAAFADPCAVCGERHSPPDRHSVILDQPERIPEDFRKKWRQICHAG